MSAPVDLSKIKPGDEVLVRAIITEAQRDNGSWPMRGVIDGISNAPGMWCGEFYFGPEAVVSHTPKALAVGDRVKIGMPQEGDILWTGKTARIVALDGNDAWLASEHGDHLTVGLHRLGRV